MFDGYPCYAIDEKSGLLPAVISAWPDSGNPWRRKGV